jgi:hypothetical protein
MRQTFILDASYDSETGITGIGIVREAKEVANHK